MKATKEQQRVIEALLPILVPFVTVRIVWGIAGVIVLLGIALSMVYANWTIFSRSGSLLVVCALLLALFDYTSSIKQLLESFEKILPTNVRDEQLEGVRELVQKELRECGVSKSEEEISYLARQKFQSSWEELPNRLGGCFKMKSVESEVLLGIMGTLIWGFGDLFGFIKF